MEEEHVWIYWKPNGVSVVYEDTERLRRDNGITDHIDEELKVYQLLSNGGKTVRLPFYRTLGGSGRRKTTSGVTLRRHRTRRRPIYNVGF
jgi:hypothetical protein